MGIVADQCWFTYSTHTTMVGCVTRLTTLLENTKQNTTKKNEGSHMEKNSRIIAKKKRERERK